MRGTIDIAEQGIIFFIAPDPGLRFADKIAGLAWNQFPGTKQGLGLSPMMETYCVDIRALNYRFGKQDQIISNLDLQVPEGSVFGFLGPNGAGKTTTLRLLLGLLRLQEGDIRIFGQSLDKQRHRILRSVGSMIESPSMYAHLSARDNLRIWQKLYACPINRINEVLSLTGIADTGSKKTGRFSLGMKQRLGIAIALLHEPRLLILDEPTNGLDPGGIQEIRELLLQLNRQNGVTILVSSHILPEMEKTASHLGIIHRGKLLYQGTLTGLSQMQPTTHQVLLQTADNSMAKDLLNVHGFNASVDHGGVRVCLNKNEDTTGIAPLLARESIGLYSMIPEKADLESIFLHLIQS
jgi:ABC-2 type transport system ATP-binding protein